MISIFYNIAIVKNKFNFKKKQLAPLKLENLKFFNKHAKNKKIIANLPLLLQRSILLRAFSYDA